MKSRRFMSRYQAEKVTFYHTMDAKGLHCAPQQTILTKCRDGSQTDAPVAGVHDRFSPNSRRRALWGPAVQGALQAQR